VNRVLWHPTGRPLSPGWRRRARRRGRSIRVTSWLVPSAGRYFAISRRSHSTPISPPTSKEHDSDNGHGDADAEHGPAEPGTFATLDHVDCEPHQAEGDPDPQNGVEDSLAANAPPSLFQCLIGADDCVSSFASVSRGSAAAFAHGAKREPQLLGWQAKRGTPTARTRLVLSENRSEVPPASRSRESASPVCMAGA
jgi:hypothetical protein